MDRDPPTSSGGGVRFHRPSELCDLPPDAVTSLLPPRKRRTRLADLVLTFLGLADQRDKRGHRGSSFVLGRVRRRSTQGRLTVTRPPLRRTRLLVLAAAVVGMPGVRRPEELKTSASSISARSCSTERSSAQAGPVADELAAKRHHVVPELAACSRAFKIAASSSAFFP